MANRRLANESGDTSDAVDPSSPHRSSVRLAAVALAAVLVLVPFLSSCSRESPTEEVRTDPADEIADGPAPTAPPEASGGTSGATEGEIDVNELIRRVDDLNNETDMCKLLTGQALRDLTRANVNLTSLLTNPSGFTQLFASLDRLFAHMVTIGPPELTASLQTMQGVWKSMSTIDPRAADAEARSSKLIGDPAVQQAQDALGAYVKTSCSSAGG